MRLEINNSLGWTIFGTIVCPLFFFAVFKGCEMDYQQVREMGKLGYVQEAVDTTKTEKKHDTIWVKP